MEYGDTMGIYWVYNVIYIYIHTYIHTHVYICIYIYIPQIPMRTAHFDAFCFQHGRNARRAATATWSFFRRSPHVSAWIESYPDSVAMWWPFGSPTNVSMRPQRCWVGFSGTFWVKLGGGLRCKKYEQVMLT